MGDYQPLDLSQMCNAGVSVLGEPTTQAPVGRQSLRGLPFLIGADGVTTGDKCFIALSRGSGSATIPINETICRVLFAHRLLESDVLEGGVPGDVIAEYVFHISGDDAVRVPVRERFEIGIVGDPFTGVGQPYIAVSDQNDWTLPRSEGNWSEAGRRQTEGVLPRPSGTTSGRGRTPTPTVRSNQSRSYPRDPGSSSRG